MCKIAGMYLGSSGLHELINYNSLLFSENSASAASIKCYFNVLANQNAICATSVDFC